MLKNLHVKNLALIEEEEIDFSAGLNILSGETGAGKSIILGALSLALGEKAAKGLLKDENEDAVVEAVFSVENPGLKEALEAMDFQVYDDEIILSRRISATKATAKINGEAVPAVKLSEVGALLLDIYGQHEHQSLSSKKKQGNLLDEYCGAQVAELKLSLAAELKNYRTIQKEYEEALEKDKDRASRQGLLEYELKILTDAKLKNGEDDELEGTYQTLKSFTKVMDSVGTAYEYTGGGSGVSEQLSRAIAALKSVEGLDSRAADIVNALTDAESIVSDANRELSSLLNGEGYSEERFREVEDRLNQLNSLKHRFGSNTIQGLIDAMSEKQSEIDMLNDFENYISGLKERADIAYKKCMEICGQLTSIRKEAASNLSIAMKTAMEDLNFLQSVFECEIRPADKMTENGLDDICFMVSTNPGQPIQPLSNVASGGEMSRISLAIKTVIASKDNIDTLIFDEIDAGISGRTAAAVAGRLTEVAKQHQVICITHLPQIAACSDTHFLIEKNVKDGSTVSGIIKLSEEDSIKEIARMISGDEITETSIMNARELRQKVNK